MAKRFIFAALILLSAAGLGSGIQFYRRNLEFLQAEGLDGPVILFLVALGIAALMTPFHLRMNWDKWSAIGLAGEYLRRFSLVLAAFTAVFGAVRLIDLLLTLPARLGRSYLLIPLLTVMVPLAMVSIDLAQQNMARTLRNFALGFGLYAFRIYGLLLIQFITIPVAFVLFPAGFFLQLLSLGDLVARWGFRFYLSEAPVLCEWFNLTDSCTAGLISFHLGHLVLALTAARFGPALFDWASNWYKISLETMQSWLETA